jgi:GTP-binding protein
MINRLANNRRLAKISQTPGKTQSLNYYLADGRYWLVDLPGYGYAKTSKKERKRFGGLVESYLTERSELKGLIQLFDARHGPVSGDLDMLDWLKEWDGDVLYVCTKADKLTAGNRAKVQQNLKKEFGLENIVIFSASTGTGVNAVWYWMDRIWNSVSY